MPWHLTLVGSLSTSYALRLHRAQALYTHPRLPCFFEAATSQFIYIRLPLASVTFNVFFGRGSSSLRHLLSTVLFHDRPRGDPMMSLHPVLVDFLV